MQIYNYSNYTTLNIFTILFIVITYCNYLTILSVKIQYCYPSENSKFVMSQKMVDSKCLSDEDSNYHPSECDDVDYETETESDSESDSDYDENIDEKENIICVEKYLNNEFSDVSDYIYVESISVDVDKIQENVKEKMINITLVINEICYNVTCTITLINNSIEYRKHDVEMDYDKADELQTILEIEFKETMNKIMYEACEIAAIPSV